MINPTNKTEFLLTIPVSMSQPSDNGIIIRMASSCKNSWITARIRQNSITIVNNMAAPHCSSLPLYILICHIVAGADWLWLNQAPFASAPVVLFFSCALTKVSLSSLALLLTLKVSAKTSAKVLSKYQLKLVSNAS